MSVPAVVTRGFGVWGSVTRVATRGFTPGAAARPVRVLFRGTVVTRRAFGGTVVTRREFS